MNICDARDAYYNASGKASDVARNLAFGGIAFIWVFKLNSSPVPKVPDELLFPAVMLAVTLAFDLLQYVFATVMWGIFHRKKEKQDNRTADVAKDFLAPRWINWPAFVCFWLKLLAVGMAYTFIIYYIWTIWL